MSSNDIDYFDDNFETIDKDNIIVKKYIPPQTETGKFIVRQINIHSTRHLINLN